MHKMPRIRVRLDWTNANLNVIQESDFTKHAVSIGNRSLDLTKLDHLALYVCRLQYWNIGPLFAEQVCQGKLTVQATGLIGIDSSSTRRKYNTYEDESQATSYSKFATFEIAFDAEEFLG